MNFHTLNIIWQNMTSPKDDGWIVLIFSHVNNLKECLICHLKLNVCRF